MGCRRLHALLFNLPRDAAIGEERGWTLQDELAARTIEETSSWLWALASMFGRVHFKSPPKFPLPMPLEHPARPKPERPAPRRARGAKEIKAFFAKNIGGGDS